MDDKGKTSIVAVLVVLICVGVAVEVIHDWWQKKNASSSSPIVGGTNALHGTVGIDYLAQKTDGSWIGLSWDSPTNPGTFTIYANPATLALYTGNGIQIQKFVCKIWINPTTSMTGATGVRMVVPAGNIQWTRTGPTGTVVFNVTPGIDKVVPLNTKTYVSEFTVFSAEDSLPSGTYRMNLNYSGTAQAVSTSGVPVGDPATFSFSDTITVIYYKEG